MNIVAIGGVSLIESQAFELTKSLSHEVVVTAITPGVGTITADAPVSALRPVTVVTNLDNSRSFKKIAAMQLAMQLFQAFICVSAIGGAPTLPPAQLQGAWL